MDILRKFKRYYSYYQDIRSFDKDSYIHTLNFQIEDDRAALEGKCLIPLISKAIDFAFKNEIEEKGIKSSNYFNIFPGEPYRILSGIVNTIKPKSLLDIGTYTGMSSRVMLDYSDQITKIKTFDLIKWNKFKDTHLSIEDFEKRNFSQDLVDLSSKLIFDKYLNLFNDSEIIYADGPKDGKFEYELCKNLNNSNLENKTRYLILDDIKFLNMVKLWRYIESPKIDISSFGHYLGTGIVDISKGLKVNKRAFKRNIKHALKRNEII